MMARLMAVVADCMCPARFQAITIDTDSHNVDPNRPQVNGDSAASATDEFENKHITDIVDDLVNSTEVSISGGSDTEAKGKEGTIRHVRTSSTIKKPASFKAINVNKTFLTAKAPAPTTQPKAIEKAPTVSTSTASPTGTPTISRPRLVAKSGGGLVAKAASGANGGKPGSAPDARAVWNKNRREQSTPPQYCAMTTNRVNSCPSARTQKVH